MPDTKSNKNQKDSQINEVVTDWQCTEEITPAFMLLLRRLLLQPRSNQAETKNGEEVVKGQHFPGGESEV